MMRYLLLTLCGVLLAVPAWATPSVAQRVINANTVITQIDCVFGSNVTAGNLIVVVTRVATTATGRAVNDTRSTSYTEHRTEGVGVVTQLSIWSGVVPTSGANTVSFTISSGTERMGCIAFEVTPTATYTWGGSRVDGSNYATANSASPDSGNLTTTNASTFWVGTTACGGTCSATIGASPWTNLQQNTTGRFAAQDFVIGTTTTDASDMTITSQNWMAMVMAFYDTPPATGSGQPPSSLRLLDVGAP